MQENKNWKIKSNNAPGNLVCKWPMNNPTVVIAVIRLGTAVLVCHVNFLLDRSTLCLSGNIFSACVLLVLVKEGWPQRYVDKRTQTAF